MTLSLMAMRRTFKRGVSVGCGVRAGAGGARPPVLLPRRNCRDRGCADHRRAERYLRGGEAGDVRFRSRSYPLDLRPSHGNRSRDRMVRALIALWSRLALGL